MKNKVPTSRTLSAKPSLTITGTTPTKPVERSLKPSPWAYMRLFLLLSLATLIESTCKAPIQSTRLSPVPLKHRNREGDCDLYFIKTEFGERSDFQAIILIGMLFQVNEQMVAACLESWINEGDHLLIQSPSTDGLIPCDDFHQEFEQFNDKLLCYGFDAPYTERRLLYNDLHFRLNFIREEILEFLDKYFSASEFLDALSVYGDTVIQFPIPENSSSVVDEAFNTRHGQYIKDLARRMKGLTISDINLFIQQEALILAEKIQSEERALPLNATHEALVSHLKTHPRQLNGERYRIFVAAGTQHVNPAENPYLKDALENSKLSLTIFTPKVNNF